MWVPAAFLSVPRYGLRYGSAFKSPEFIVHQLVDSRQQERQSADEYWTAFRWNDPG